MAKGSRGTFGFRNVNGKAFKITVTSKVSDKLMTKDAPMRLQQKVVAMMNRSGRKAWQKTQDLNWTPHKTGRLMKSIKWHPAKVSGKGNITRGKLTADTPYARRQEFEHKTKRFFLRRAILNVAQPDFVMQLRNKKMMQEAFYGLGISGVGFRG